MKPQLSKLKNHARLSRDFIIDLIFPVECLGCGEEGVWLCRRCFAGLDFKAAQYCLHCKSKNDFGKFCSQCAPAYRLDGILIAGDYENATIARMIKALKYHFAENIAAILGDYLSLFLRNLINKTHITEADLARGGVWRKVGRIPGSPSFFSDPASAVIIPVPLHAKRRRWRGFNQAEPIAAKLARNFRFKLNIGDLIRVKHKSPQAKLNERERRENIRDCFAWHGGNLAGKCAILVDDVTTTGSTLNECAKILKTNGAGEVWGLVIAKG
jgi:competence protein ComFC